MKPNLARISGSGDRQAEQIVAGTPTIVNTEFLSSVEPHQLDLGRYGIRHATVALRKRSERTLESALLASALSAAVDSRDDRDLMTGLALHHVVAESLGLSPAELFTRVAERFPGTPISELLRVFGARRDVTLSAFGWQRVDAPDGPDFVPTA